MPHRFPTEAANADVLGEDPQDTQQSPQAPPDAGAGDAPRKRAPRAAAEDKAKADSEARPGKDINQAGYLKDTDRERP